MANNSIMNIETLPGRMIGIIVRRDLIEEQGDEKGYGQRTVTHDMWRNERGWYSLFPLPAACSVGTNTTIRDRQNLACERNSRGKCADASQPLQRRWWYGCASVVISFRKSVTVSMYATRDTWDHVWVQGRCNPCRPWTYLVACSCYICHLFIIGIVLYVFVYFRLTRRKDHSGASVSWWLFVNCLGRGSEFDELYR